MTSRVSHTTFDCHDAFELSEWWKPVIGYTDIPGDPNEPGDEECMIADPNIGHRLLFIKVEDLRSDHGRIHLDLVPTDRRRDDEIDRVVALGATQIADRRNRDGTGWMVLADPAGNRFCISRSDEERSETSA
ncbi:MAG TPA: VOC family protein [Ilumatobacter sp.]|nr:VOC family protein [Ilumatobacter sp.]